MGLFEAERPLRCLWSKNDVVHLVGGVPGRRVIDVSSRLIFWHCPRPLDRARGSRLPCVGYEGSAPFRPVGAGIFKISALVVEAMLFQWPAPIKIWAMAVIDRSDVSTCNPSRL